jgi:hypothetical protein
MYTVGSITIAITHNTAAVRRDFGMPGVYCTVALILMV